MGSAVMVRATASMAASLTAAPSAGAAPRGVGVITPGAKLRVGVGAVSYTHLTLPTSDLV